MAFTDPDKDRGVSGGVIPERFGNRNAPSAMYAAFSPDFDFNGELVGGQFWDERAANLTEQAKGPFLNPLEMNNPDQAAVLDKIKNASYASLFDQVCGGDTESQYTCMANAIAAFENTHELNKFSSKFDQSILNPTLLTVQERKGQLLFNGRGRCFICHPEPIFTDFDAENIGVPSNLGMMGNTPALQHYYPLYYSPPVPEFNPAGLNFTDVGKAGNPSIPAVLQPVVKGQMKAPTLRNVELTAPYMHNGVFKDLKTVVHFYNTRDVLGNCAVRTNPQPGVNCWPTPEVLVNMNVVIGNLRLTDDEENDIVAFLLTFTDSFGSQQARTKGDVDDKPGLDVGDGLFAMQAVAGLRQFTAVQESSADVDGSGTLDVGDCLLILQAVAGLRTI